MLWLGIRVYIKDLTVKYLTSYFLEVNKIEVKILYLAVE